MLSFSSFVDGMFLILSQNAIVAQALQQQTERSLGFSSAAMRAARLERWVFSEKCYQWKTRFEQGNQVGLWTLIDYIFNTQLQTLIYIIMFFNAN